MKKEKRLAIIIAVAVFAVVVIATGTFSYAFENAKKNAIGIDKAIGIALTHAGADEQDTTVTKAKMEFEKGTFVYDVEFIVNGVDEYDYTIKSADGTVLDSSHELEDDTDKPKNSGTVSTTEQDVQNANHTEQSTTQQADATTPKSTTKASESKASTDISLEDAKNIALKNAGVSKADADFTSAHKDYDDGIYIYEIEFVTSSYKYEYEITMNGKIISYDKDVRKSKKQKTTTKKSTTKKTSSNAKYIGVDSAKKIALKNSGLSAGDVTFTKAKLEKDDGIYVYEIEFVTATMEYEYEINATTGKITDKSVERIDD